MTEDDFQALPPRPRRRLLAPAPLALLAVLSTACGFIAGVLVEKGQTSAGSSGGGGAAGLASRFAALRSASGASSAAAAAAGSGAGSGGVGAAGGFAASGSGRAGGATIGQVAYVDGGVLYVTTAEGNTVKVKTSAASTVTKTVNGAVKEIRPGETVLIAGATGAKGEVIAESIRIGGGAGAGLGAPLGGSGRGSNGGSEPALFGKSG